MIELEPGARLRRGGRGDLDALLAIRAGLPMPRGARTRSGGFLLGSDPAVYGQLLAGGRVWLLEVAGEVVGFSVTLDDAALRRSALWDRREQVDWSQGLDPEALLGSRIAYFDQLAVLPDRRNRYWGVFLAVRALDELFADHDLVLTTTVVEPIVNDAALPLLVRAHARRLGVIEERYPEVGRVCSAIHLIDAAGYQAGLEALRARVSPRGRGSLDAVAFG
ncbi:hypothetical protein G6O69_16795 [Pseudenhygromyxa sp. WMMC2535]|uniref:hypothetical protein n=1 Tax=Pseudenhygromyxa sp. WMMC2535 TaxID=2712867 RepID=UPI0015540155|nr:hypothetical protein [Pseudenhygromyxa sp. WMMC2535]NVB39502.1 hypothetical protein [Pseudenhygromyxa sp. WMMC2535]